MSRQRDVGRNVDLPRHALNDDRANVERQRREQLDHPPPPQFHLGARCAASRQRAVTDEAVLEPLGQGRQQRLHVVRAECGEVLQRDDLEMHAGPGGRSGPGTWLLGRHLGSC